MGLPSMWVCSLVASRNIEQLAAVETSVRGKLGFEVERHLRVIEMVLACNKPEPEKVIFKNDLWETKTDVRDGFYALVDIAGYLCLESHAEIPGMSQVQDALTKRARATIAALQERLSTHKSAVHVAAWQKCQEVSGFLESRQGDSNLEEMMKVVRVFSNDKELTKAMQDIVARLRHRPPTRLDCGERAPYESLQAVMRCKPQRRWPAWC